MHNLLDFLTSLVSGYNIKSHFCYGQGNFRDFLASRIMFILYEFSKMSLSLCVQDVQKSWTPSCIFSQEFSLVDQKTARRMARWRNPVEKPQRSLDLERQYLHSTILLNLKCQAHHQMSCQTLETCTCHPLTLSSPIQ